MPQYARWKMGLDLFPHISSNNRGALALCAVALLLVHDAAWAVSYNGREVYSPITLDSSAATQPSATTTATTTEVPASGESGVISQSSEAASTSPMSAAQSNSGQALTEVDEPPRIFAIIEFIGATEPVWLEDVQAFNLEIVQFLPEKSYLVSGTAAKLAAFGASHHYVASISELPESFKLTQELSTLLPIMDGSTQVTFLTRNAYNPELLDYSMAADIVGQVTNNGWYVNRAALNSTQIAQLQKSDEVFHIEVTPQYEMHGERGAQSVAGEYPVAATAPLGPGYAQFLAKHNLTGGDGIIVQVQDGGIDQGIATNLPGTAHPDILGRIAGIFNATSDSLGDGPDGHGHINAAIIAGNASLPTTDSDGYRLGQGVAPTAQVYGTKIFRGSGFFDLSSFTFADLAKDAQDAGARISNNSWGASLSGTYTADSAIFDGLTRDADPVEPGNQEMIYFFSAGNSGPFTQSLGSPATAKNVIAVGASENSDADGFDGCNTGPSESDSIRDLADFSSRGPTRDGRQGVTLVSVGTHVQGAVSTSPFYAGSSVCDPFWPLGQTDYARSTGTSHSAPLAAGAAAVIVEFFDKHLAPRGHKGQPSAAMIKAVMTNTARDIAGGGNGAGGTLDNVPNVQQGWGAVNLANLFEQKDSLYSIDQDHLFTATGQRFQIELTPVDPSKPVKVSLAWTDMPALPSASVTLVNNLDLEVVDQANSYLGNVFSSGVSVTGGTPDNRENLEQVFLASPSGNRITVNVIASNIAGDGVPNNITSLDQDFALFVSNAIVLGPEGMLDLERDITKCQSEVGVELADLDLQGNGTQLVTVSAGADLESISLVEQEPGFFEGILRLRSTGAPQSGDGFIEVTHADQVTVSYADQDDGTGSPALVSKVLDIDCDIPRVLQNTVLPQDVYANVSVQTSGADLFDVQLGLSCANRDIDIALEETGYASFSGKVDGLSPDTTYYYAYRLEDEAGNIRIDDNGGYCRQFTTSNVSTNNLGFEDGNLSDWQSQDLFNPFFGLGVQGGNLTSGFGCFSTDPSEGEFAAVHGFDGTVGQIVLQRQMLIDPFLRTLEFDYRACWDMTYGATQPRRFDVEVQSASGESVTNVLTANPGQTVLDTGTTRQQIDLAQYAGQVVTVSFVWDIPESFTGPGLFQLDDVVLTRGLPDRDRDGLTDDQELVLGTDPDNPDSDGDGLSDGEEVSDQNTNPLSDDTDGDGLKDLYEIDHGFNPRVAGEQLQDNDFDGLNNLAEQAAGSDPFDSDSDDDGLNDFAEVVVRGTNPLSNDTDGDALQDLAEIVTYGTDPLLPDTDGGGTDDGTEALIDGTDPLDPADDFVPITLPYFSFDGQGFLWDIATNGSISNGSNDAFDGGFVLTINGLPFLGASNGRLENNRREVVIEASVAGFDVSRKVFVPDDDGLIRYLEIIHNPGASPLSASVSLSTNYGADLNSILIGSSTGAASLGPDDNFSVIADSAGFSPVVPHVFHNENAKESPVQVGLAGDVQTIDFDLTVEPGETKIIMHFASQRRNPDEALLQADLIENLPPYYLRAATQTEIDQIVNFIIDADGDGLSDSDEANAGTDPNNPDSDGDGLLDGFEVRYGFDPLRDNGEATADSDGDGLDNLAEQAAGASPLSADTDGDGLTDDDEVARGTNPSREDTDRDDLDDFAEVNVYATDPTVFDTDGGGVGDGQEVLIDGTDPLNPTDDIVIVNLPFDLIDGGSFLWDVQGSGRLLRGGPADRSNPSWDIDAMTLRVNGVFFPSLAQAKSRADFRELVLDNETLMSGLEVSRRVFVPDDDSFARYIERFYNPGSQPITVSVEIYNDYQFSGLSISTSSGDSAVSTADSWVIAEEQATGIAVTNAAYGADGSPLVVPSTFRLSSDDLDYSYTVTVPPGEFVSILHFASQAASLADAQAIASRLVSPAADMLLDLPLEIITEIVNYDLDTDGDGLADVVEIGLGTDPNNPDSDGDGLRDGFEVEFGFDPLSDSGEALVDSDGDGLINLAEQVAGSSPLQSDTDADGLDDLEEANLGTDPANADTDGDRLSDSDEVNVYGTDPRNPDTDDGGVNDGDEVLDDFTNPLNPNDDTSEIFIPVTLRDSLNFIWDIRNDGSISNGSIDAYDGAFRLRTDRRSFIGSNPAKSESGGREIRISESASTRTSVRTTRKVYVPLDAAYARFLEIVTNHGSSTANVLLEIDTNLGSDGSTVVVATSTGDSILTPLDNYIVTDDFSSAGGDPTTVHVFSDDLAPLRASSAFQSRDSISLDYNFSLAPGETKIIMHFAAQRQPRNQGEAIATDILADIEPFLAGMSFIERSQVVNFDMMLQDTDGDGLSDGIELVLGTNPNNPDTDGDGLLDGFEVEFGFNPRIDIGEATADADGDGVDNIGEQSLGTSPVLSDTDADGLTDGEELPLLTDPLNPDTDADRLNDGDEVNVYGTSPVLADTDGGGVNDGDEVIDDMTDPLNAVDDIPATLPIALIDAESANWTITNRYVTGFASNGVSTWDINKQLSISNYTWFGNGTARSTTAGRELVIPPFPQLAQIVGVNVERRVYVPASGSGYARFIERFNNPGRTPVTVTVRLFEDYFGFGVPTQIETSSGDAFVSPLDNYMLSRPSNGNFAVTGISDGLATTRPTRFSLDNTEDITVSYALTIPAGQTRSIMHFSAQKLTLLEARSAAQSFEAPTAAMLTGIPALIRNEIVNYNLAAVTLLDSDNDGLADIDEEIHRTDPMNEDSDGDGLLDSFEIAHGFNPLQAGEQNEDPDGDGVTNIEEQQQGTSPFEFNAVSANVPMPPWSLFFMLLSLGWIARRARAASWVK